MDIGLDKAANSLIKGAASLEDDLVNDAKVLLSALMSQAKLEGEDFTKKNEFYIEVSVRGGFRPKMVGPTE